MMVRMIFVSLHNEPLAFLVRKERARKAASNGYSLMQYDEG